MTVHGKHRVVNRRYGGSNDTSMKERTYIYIGARSEGLGDEYTHSLLYRSQLKLRGGETASQG